jgi:hypothetical protein
MVQILSNHDLETRHGCLPYVSRFDMDDLSTSARDISPLHQQHINQAQAMTM